MLALRLAVRRLEARDELAAELDRHVAALGDLQGGRDRLRELGERLRHLLRALEVELVGVEGHLRLRERRLRLHAQQRGVVVVVLAAQVVHVGGRDERPAHLPGELDDRLVDLLLLGDPVALDLEVDVLGTEDVDEVVQVRAGLREPAVDDAAARTRGEAARQRDDAVAVALQQLHVDARLAAVEALEEAGAGQLRQVLEADVVAREEREVVALDLALADRAVVDVVRLEAQDRLHAVLLAGLEQLHGAVHDAVVGQAEGRLPVLGRTGGELLDLARAVEQRVLGVNVEVGAGGGAHGLGRLDVRSDVAAVSGPTSPHAAGNGDRVNPRGPGPGRSRPSAGRPRRGRRGSPDGRRGAPARS